MADRDLLHKPIPLVMPEEKATGKKAMPAPATDKLGLTARARDIGDSGTPVALKKVTEGGGEQAPATPATSTEAPRETRGPAYKQAYFTKDVGSTQQANLRSRPMQALRGGEGATDLKRIVLPPSGMVEAPNPDQLRQATGLMGLAGQQLDLGGMLNRQGNWARGKNVTVEMIQERMAQMQQMINDRIAALQRMAKMSSDRLARSVTLAQAATQGGEALQNSEDVAHDGAALIRDTAGQADAMHARLAKVLGIKSQG